MDANLSVRSEDSDIMTEQSIQQRLVELDTVVQASPQRVRRLSQTHSEFGSVAAAASGMRRESA